MQNKIGKIYKIYEVEHPENFYISSTYQQLSNRLGAHRKASKSDKLKDTKLYEHVNSVQGGWDHFKIELVEQSKDPLTIEQLHQMESKYKEQLKPTLNTNIIRSKSEKTTKSKTHNLHDKAIKLFKDQNKDNIIGSFYTYIFEHHDELSQFIEQYLKDHEVEAI